MNGQDMDHLRSWVGKEKNESDQLDVRHARLMAATLDHPVSEIAEGQPLPPLWHWAYFLEGLPPGELGQDGHPARGAFLPPVPLPNRMWAGGALTFHEPLIIGTTMDKRSHIVSVEGKQGKTGPLVFVKVRHELSRGGKLLVTEDQDIVYTGPRKGGNPEAGQMASSQLAFLPEHAELGSLMKRYMPTSTLLFRYSALTFNGHRIHYDADYCREVEGYPDLVVHGPLNATLLANYAQQRGGILTSFHYRGVRPAFLGTEIGLYIKDKVQGMQLSMVTPDSDVVMKAECQFL